MNVYGYAGGNPLSFVDTLGLAPNENFETPDDAAIDMWSYITKNSKRDGKFFGQSRKEIGNEITKNGNCHTYSDNFQIGETDRIYRRTKPENHVANFHSHTQVPLRQGDPSIGFSGKDLSDRNMKYNETSYVGYIEINPISGTFNKKIQKSTYKNRTPSSINAEGVAKKCKQNP